MSFKGDFGFLGITIKDIISFLLLVVSATIFVTNMNNRIDNLTSAVERFNQNYDKKDAVDSDQYKRIEANERMVIILQEQFRLRDPQK